MTEEQEKEFAWFRDIESKLKRAFVEGYNHPQADDLGFLVAQSIRDVPTLLRILEHPENYSNDELLDAIHAVVCNHSALSEANRIITNVRD